ncbi:site-2 protease family protein [Halobacteriales archaeon Cl-PHB]
MRSLTVGRVWDIPIRLHVSLLVFLPVLAWLLGSGVQIELYTQLINAVWPGTLDPGAFAPGARSWTIGIAGAVGLFASVAVHELGHAFVARRYDIEVEAITLWILGGLASLTQFPREWRREFWIAVAGPVTSLVVAGGSWAVLQTLPAGSPTVVFVVGWLALTNVVLAVFNMLPAFPMDGGRVLRALLARRRPYVQATRIAARIGTIFAIIFAVLGLVVTFNPILILLALFIYGAASSESRVVVLDDLLDGLTVGDLARTDQAGTVAADETAADVLSHLLSTRRMDLAVSDGDAIVGVVTAGSLRGVDATAYETTPVSEFMADDLPRFDADMDAFDALVALNGARSEVAIVEAGGTPVGTLSQDDFSAALAIRRETTVAM